MPGWNKVLQEISKKQGEGQQAVDLIRRQYLRKLHSYSKRNVIAYYSGWLSRPSHIPNLEIGDDDKNGFMSAVHNLDRKQGLDLILHTPGGNIAATESLVQYLWQLFDKDIRVIVPQLAMSCGTMIACASKAILMGKQSNLGPIDPQFGGVAAQAVIEEFQMAIRHVEKNPSSALLWQAIIGKYHPTFILECLQAIEWSRNMVKSWLMQNMFAELPNAEELADRIVGALGDHASTKTHSRHLSIEACREMGLNVISLENDDKLQDLVLTVHHSFMHTFGFTGAIKIIENHLGVATVLMQQVQMVQGLPTPVQQTPVSPNVPEHVPLPDQAIPPKPTEEPPPSPPVEE